MPKKAPFANVGRKISNTTLCTVQMPTTPRASNSAISSPVTNYLASKIGAGKLRAYGLALRYLLPPATYNCAHQQQSNQWISRSNQEKLQRPQFERDLHSHGRSH